MKKLIIFFLIFFLASELTNAQQLLQESFETNGEGTRYSSNTFQTGCSDYFTRMNNTPATYCVTTHPTNPNGSFYWASEDSDQASGGEGVITFNSLTVTGLAIDVDVFLAVGRPNDFRLESSDYFIMEYNMDSAGWNIFGAFYGNTSGNLQKDTDLNGSFNATGLEINTSNFIDVNFTIPVTGTSLQVRIRALTNTGTEEIVFDNIRINGTTASVQPTVTTANTSSLANTSVTLTGNVSSNGGATITERGFVYSKTADNNNPLISGTSVTKITDGTGTGSFSESITNLSAGTPYSFKAYAINSVGTSYGSVLTFTTTGKGWTGETNTNWSTASNWSPNSVPIATDNLVIPNVANKPVININTAGLANNITIDAFSSVTLESGGSLIINGVATVNGNFIYNVNVSDDKWHLVSSPVKNEQYNDAWNTLNNIDTNLPNEAIANYINTTDANGDWQYYQHNVSGSISFDAGIGYSLKRTAAGNFSFVGSFPSAPINTTISANDIGGANENRWTLVGNPFPAHINIETFLTTNTTPLRDTHESVYVWNANAGVSGEYQPLETGYIHPGQGFFVNSDVASTSVTFTKAMQSDQNGIIFYKNSNPKIKLIIDDGSNKKSTEINYLLGKTTGLDSRFDVGTFTGQASGFNIFTHLVSESEGVNFAKQALPNTDYENMVIPVGLNVAANKEIIFTVDISNLPKEFRVYLEDKVANTFTLLDENRDYKISSSEKINGIGRFYIHTKNSVLNIDDNSSKDISIYKINDVNIRIVGLQNSETNVQLFNLLGKQVFTTSFIADGIKDISLSNLASGIYIVQLQTEKGILNKKIILE